MCICIHLHAAFWLQHLRKKSFWARVPRQMNTVTWELLGQCKHFSQNGSPVQTTVLTRRAREFCVKPRSPFSKIFHHYPKTIGKPSHIVSWSECQCFHYFVSSYFIIPQLAYYCLAFYFSSLVKPVDLPHKVCSCRQRSWFELTCISAPLSKLSSICLA